MLARASSDAGVRLRRSKSTLTVHRHPSPISETLDRDVARQQALAAATAAFVRGKGHDVPDCTSKRSSDLSRSKSSTSRKSLTSQGSHFPPRESSFRSLQAQDLVPTASNHHQSRASAANTEQFPAFYPILSTARPASLPRPLSSQASITCNESARSGSQPRSHQQSAASSITSQQIRKARSMYYASSVQTGSPIARPPAKYLTTPSPISELSTLGPASAPLTARSLRRSPLAPLRIPVTIATDESVDKARDEYLQSFQQKTVKHKPSIFLAPFVKRQDKGKAKSKRITSDMLSNRTTTRQTPEDFTADIILDDFIPQSRPNEKRSFSGSLKSKFKKVFRRTSHKSTNLPVQQIEASRDYFSSTHLSPSNVIISYAIPSPDGDLLRRVRSRTPSVEDARPILNKSASRTSSNGSSKSNGSGRSLHSETNTLNISASRVTSWGTSASGDTLTQRAMKRLTVIHEAKDSIGSEADRAASMVPKRKPLPLPALASFRDPIPMDSLVEGSLTTVDPKRVFSALLREIDASKSAEGAVSCSEQTPGATSDVFESSATKELQSTLRELHSSASRDFGSTMSSDQRPSSRRPASAAAASVQSKASTIRSLGRAIRSTIRTVTPVEQKSVASLDHASNIRSAMYVPKDDVDTLFTGSNRRERDDDDDEADVDGYFQPSHDPMAVTHTPTASQIERRVEKAKERWKSPLENAEPIRLPRETNRTYDLANFAQQTTDSGLVLSPQLSQQSLEQETFKPSNASRHPESPTPQQVMSPLSPSIYSRNTDGMSILPNDSVMSFNEPDTLERSQHGGSAVILNSQSVRSYVIGTPSPRRPDLSRTSCDWKAWLSHEISGMETTSQEDLTIHEPYATPSGNDRCVRMRTSHTEQGGDTTVILRESIEVPTPRPGIVVVRGIDISDGAEQPIDQLHTEQPEHSVNPTTSIIGRSDSPPDACRKLSPNYTPQIAAQAHSGMTSLLSGPASSLRRPRVLSTPSRHSSASPLVLETPKSRMNERFPFMDTGRRSSSNSARSSRLSKSPSESIASPQSARSMKVDANAGACSDHSFQPPSHALQRVPNTALKRSDALHKRKENITPDSLLGNQRPNILRLEYTSRAKSLQPLTSASLNQNPSSAGEYMIRDTKHCSSPATSPSRPHIRASLRPIASDKLTRRPKSAFDLRGTVSNGKPSIMGLTTATLRPASELRRPALHIESSAGSLILSKEPDSAADDRIDSVLEGGCSGGVTPGQRMAHRFLKERKSTPALESGRARGALKLVREDTPAFL